MLVVIADTTPIINLAIIGLLDKTPAFLGQLIVPPTVKAECIDIRDKREVESIAACYANGVLKVYDSFDTNLMSALSMFLDSGESEAIALAKSMDAPLLIDEKKGRKAASAAGIAVFGTLRAIEIAKQKGVIDKVLPCINILLENDIRLSHRLINLILQRNGE